MEADKINQSNPDKTMPYFFLVTKEYVIGTPRGMDASERTLDMYFEDFAKNLELQYILGLAVSGNNVGERIKFTTGYLAAFGSSEEERKQRGDYLSGNGLIRILVMDDKLKTELDELLLKQQIEREEKELKAALAWYEKSGFPSVNYIRGSDELDKIGVDFMTNQPIFKVRRIQVN